MKEKVVSDTDIKYMMQAIKLASCGLYTSYPNPAVGCVIVRDGKVLGKGYHHKAGLPHAEVMALTDANFNVEGATAYVTLEPCSHYGRTPPCAVKLVEMKVKRVVVATGDPNPKVYGRGFQILRDAGIEVVEHVLEKEAFFQNRAFMKAITGPYPYVSAKVGMSLDAKTALANGQSKWITNSKSRAKVQQLRALCDCIITSSNTVIADDPRMNVRYEELSGKILKKIDKEYIRQPLKVILDTHEKVDINRYQIFKQGKVILACGSEDKSKFFSEEIVNDTITKVYFPIVDNGVDLDALLRYLGKLQIRHAFVEAGSILTSAFINQGHVDELYAFVGAKALGQDARDAFTLKPIENLDNALSFELHKVKKFDSDVMLHYILKDHYKQITENQL